MVTKVITVVAIRKKVFTLQFYTPEVESQNPPKINHLEGFEAVECGQQPLGLTVQSIYPAW